MGFMADAHMRKGGYGRHVGPSNVVIVIVVMVLSFAIVPEYMYSLLARWVDLYV